MAGMQRRQLRGDVTQVVVFGEPAEREIDRSLAVIIGWSALSRHATPHAAPAEGARDREHSHRADRHFGDTCHTADVSVTGEFPDTEPRNEPDWRVTVFRYR
jgi:hypothetical protein